MYATDYFETIILNLARGISATAPQTMYLALFLNNPADVGSGTEVSYSGYARQPITFSAPAPSGGGMAVQNTETITFAKAEVDVGNATHVGVLDSLTGGNMYVYGPLTEMLNIQANVSPVVRANAVKWISSGKMSNAYKTKVLNLMRGTNCPGFTPYLALCNGSPEAGGAEFVGNAYERMQVAFGSPSPQAGGAMMMSNSATITSPVATGTWGQLTHIAIYDAENSGSPYLIDSANPSTLMSKDKAVIYDVGALKFSIN
jgi:hypothetical protein